METRSLPTPSPTDCPRADPSRSNSHTPHQSGGEFVGGSPSRQQWSSDRSSSPEPACWRFCSVRLTAHRRLKLQLLLQPRISARIGNRRLGLSPTGLRSRRLGVRPPAARLPVRRPSPPAVRVPPPGPRPIQPMPGRHRPHGQRDRRRPLRPPVRHRRRPRHPHHCRLWGRLPARVRSSLHGRGGPWSATVLTRSTSMAAGPEATGGGSTSATARARRGPATAWPSGTTTRGRGCSSRRWSSRARAGRHERSSRSPFSRNSRGRDCCEPWTRVRQGVLSPNAMP